MSKGTPPPLWVLLVGGLGIVLGLATYGYRVIATVGEGIAKLTFARGFVAQLSTALVVLSATLLGVSVSTTHCLIGAIAGVALVDGRNKINMVTVRKIIVSWVVSVIFYRFICSFSYAACCILSPTAVSLDRDNAFSVF